ncbi:UDP-glucose dehydrogenase family protein [Piscinibacter koreensis]|uniref:UDP-glucose 6-dehydrogenase n=1 Tax=Piscinibacter koreensis TaxID=2742824 RepID=A0A7Y6NLX9_9BURK|nr:UDP-glucose/GDP-mannose dehydrogenase family protein [Schlegelella koreensis]NUZ05544.1 UDP-glucose/GDP-mannose dehydrogenase family protein [Schlegelella koreensis]
MNITVLGTGYVGLVTGACLAEIGNHVVCYDPDRRKIDVLESGGMPIHERQLPEVVARNVQAGRLRFTTEIEPAVRHGDIVFIATGTPADQDGSADLQYVLAAARSIGRHMQGYKVVVQKSTVPVGTASKVRQAIEDELAARRTEGDAAAGSSEQVFPVGIVSNPEFLKEGSAVDDFMRPDRIVIGTGPGEAGQRARDLMTQLYAPFNRQRERILYMDLNAAELTKYAANAMLATRISFMNELANLADKVGVDIEQVRKGIGSDPRIGYSFLYPGVGYGGSCFPKDVQALVRTAADHGQRLQVLEAVRAVNDAQKHVLFEKIVARFGDDLHGRTFALWGLAFKPNTDDMREAPSRVMIRALVERGAAVVAYDPVAMTEAKRVLALDFADSAELLRRVYYAPSPMQAVEDADALVIVTEWTAFKSPDFHALKSALKQPVIFDGRNLYDPDIRAQGFEYMAIGR